MRELELRGCLAPAVSFGLFHACQLAKAAQRSHQFGAQRLCNISVDSGEHGVGRPYLLILADSWLLVSGVSVKDDGFGRASVETVNPGIA